MAAFRKFDPYSFLAEESEGAAKAPNAPKFEAAVIGSLATLGGLGTWPLDEERAGIIEFDGDVPREWAEGFARLSDMPCPHGFDSARWLRFIDDAGVFLDRWAARAAALGWSTEAIFGLHADVKLSGLIAILDGATVTAMTEGTARARTPGGRHLTCYRQVGGIPLAIAWDDVGKPLK